MKAAGKLSLDCFRAFQFMGEGITTQQLSQLNYVSDVDLLGEHFRSSMSIADYKFAYKVVSRSPSKGVVTGI